MNIQSRLSEFAESVWPPTESYVLDRRGLPVDVSGEVWRLNEPTSSIALDWSSYAFQSAGLKNSFRRYFAWLVTTQLPISVRNAFYYIQSVSRTEAFRAADQNGGAIPYLAFSEARAALGPSNQWQLHHARQLYRWCLSQGYPQFSRDVANRLDDLVIGGNMKGQAVRSKDPDKGPLDAQEVAAITSALRAARLEGLMPLDEQAALWLALSTGSNSGQYACLREEDLTVETLGGEIVAFLLRIPRHKKGHAQHRTEFRTRRLTRFVGAVLQDLIDENRRKHPVDTNDQAARPLFRAPRPSYGHNHPLAEWDWHVSRQHITNLIKRGVKRLRVLSRRGEAIQLNTRRFRYTLATRLIDSGGSAYEVADALDHTDLQNVGVYFDVHSNIVDHLDRTLAMALAPRAQAFAKLVEREESAERGNLKGSRCYYGDREREISEPVGTCGNHSFCNIAAAPLACYTCSMFQPWMDGPHDLVLDGLLREREKRLELGLSPKMVAINDHVITEVAGVIQRISAKRTEQHG